MAYDNNYTLAIIGFKSDLWCVADALRSNMDAAEYKHVVLGLIFLKDISGAHDVLLKICTAMFNSVLAY